MSDLERISCENCVAACCRAHTGLQLTKDEAYNNRRQMNLKCIVRPKEYKRECMVGAEGWTDGQRHRVNVPMEIKAWHGLYLLLEDCGNLQGNLCSIHESDKRPQTCSLFEAGSTPCLMARAAFKDLIENIRDQENPDSEDLDQ